MSLPANQQRILDRIDGTLRASEPQLYSMFALFARLNAAEPVRVEPLARPRGPRPFRWMGAGTTIYAFVLVPVMFALITVGALLSSRTHAGTACGTGYAGGGLVSSRQWCHLTMQKTAQKTAASGARLAACAARFPVVTFVTRVGAQVLPPVPALAMAGPPAVC